MTFSRTLLYGFGQLSVRYFISRPKRNLPTFSKAAHRIKIRDMKQGQHSLSNVQPLFQTALPFGKYQTKYKQKYFLACMQCMCSAGSTVVTGNQRTSQTVSYAKHHRTHWRRNASSERQSRNSA